MDERTRDPGTPVEARSEFDLERAIQEWRAGFTTLAIDELDELVDHVREEFGCLRGLGLAEDEAWLLAARRMGSRAAVEREFAKVKGQRQLPVFLLGYLRVLLCLGLLESFAGMAMAIALPFGTTGIVAAFAFGTIMSGGLLAFLLPRLALGLPDRARLRPWPTVTGLLFTCALGLPLGRLGVSLLLERAFDSNVNLIAEFPTFARALTLIDIASLAIAYALCWFISRKQLRILEAAG